MSFSGALICVQPYLCLNKIGLFTSGESGPVNKSFPLGHPDTRLLFQKEGPGAQALRGTFLSPAGVPKGQHPAVREGPLLAPWGHLGQGISGHRYAKTPLKGKNPPRPQIKLFLSQYNLNVY